jgi:hypothetical protein
VISPKAIEWLARHGVTKEEAEKRQLSTEEVYLPSVGTTRNTIGAIRDRSHWNIQNITPKDPVTLGLCSQRELDAMVAKAAKRAGVTEDAEAPVKSERNDREKLIEELRAERDATHKAAAEAAQEAEAEAWLARKREAEANEEKIDPESGFISN